MGSEVFLDLKFHDIPDQVAGAAREVARHRVKMFTVHALGGARMIAEAAEAAGQVQTSDLNAEAPMCIAVTLLTSHSEQELQAVGLQPPIEPHVKHLASEAMNAGAQGVVASGHELAALRKILPASTCYVVPGIRGPNDELGDQHRVMSPYSAIQAGATYLVVGRPIRLAEDPISAAVSIQEQIAEALR